MVINALVCVNGKGDKAIQSPRKPGLGVSDVIVSTVVQKDLCMEITLERRPEENEEANQADTWKESVLERKRQQQTHKDPEARACLETVPGWLQSTEQGERNSKGGQVCGAGAGEVGLFKLLKDFGF